MVAKTHVVKSAANYYWNAKRGWRSAQREATRYTPAEATGVASLRRGRAVRLTKAAV